MLQHQSTEVSQMREVPLAAKELATQFFLELMYSATERRNADAALLCSARKIQSLTRFEKIADLMQFHGTVPAIAPSPDAACGFLWRAQAIADSIV